MNRCELYQQAYGNDDYWREGYVDVSSDVYITLREYESRKNTEDMTSFMLVYPLQEIQQNRQERSMLPGFQEILLGSAQDAQAILWGWSCDYLKFKQKLAVSDTIFSDLYTNCNLQESNYLAELFVRPDQQGKGLGTEVLDRYIALSFDQGKKGILTRTTSLKRNPQKMFLEKGFQEIFDYGPTDKRKRKLFYLLLDA